VKVFDCIAHLVTLTMPTSPHLKILRLEVDPDTCEGDYRILVDGKHIKYISVSGGIWSVDDMCFSPVLLPQLPVFPEGKWNTGHIAMSPETQDPVFSSTTEEYLPSITTTWHPLNVEYLGLTLGEKLLSNVHEATSPDLGDSVVIAKFADFHWEIGYYNDEVLAYSWLEDTDIGPKFLGNITEDGRTIGFLVEKISGRHAEHADLPLCEEVLSKLHALGIVHNDVNRHNFIISGDRAWLLDFEMARKTSDEDLMEREMMGLKGQLNDKSGRGGIVRTLVNT